MQTTTHALTGASLKLGLAATLALALAACAKPADKAAPAPAAQAASAPVAAASAAPAATAAAAEEAKAAEGPYLYTLLEDAALKAAWQRMSAKAPRWVRDVEGPTVPAQQVTIGGHTYWKGSLCQRHNCPNTFFFLLSAERAYGVHGDFGKSAAQLKQLKPAFYGAPPQAERAALQALFEDERKSQLGEHTR